MFLAVFKSIKTMDLFQNPLIHILLMNWIAYIIKLIQLIWKKE